MSVTFSDPRASSVHGRRRPVRPAALLALAVAVVAVLLGWAAPAWAADQGARNITRYDADVQLAADGSARVTLDFDFDFADTPGHGPFLTLPIRQAIEGSDQVRVYDVSDVTASSPTGAPANVNLDRTSYWLDIKIGDPDIGDVSGVQRYVVSYTLDGIVNPDAGGSGQDEFFWNVIGADWVVPISDLAVTVDGPADVLDTICFAGPVGSTQACTSSGHDGTRATFTQAALAPSQAFTIDVAYPGGTFVGAEPVIEDAPAPPNPFALTPWVVALGAGVLVGGGALAIWRSGRHGRDQQYLGLTPGLAPAPGQDGAVGPARRAPITVQFTPPEGVRAGQMGTLVDEVADPRDVTATIIDLAVRGYLRIEEVEPPNRWGRGGDWTLRFIGGPDDLLPYERELLDSLFATSLSVTLSGIRTTFASAMARVQAKLYTDVTQRGWFAANPRSVRSRWMVAGGAVIALGAAIGFALAPLNASLVGVGVALVGVVTMIVSRRAPARTAAGTAVLAQTLGFKRYLETAEANQLRFEEGEDLFSRYLPFAIVFGVAERWAGVFEQLARQGRAVAEPTWYVSRTYLPGYFWLSASHFGQTMDSFSQIATTAIAAPTPGSSGGSGFGGGGFSGGGGGGGGGGGW
jgi:hypothetical protein